MDEQDGRPELELPGFRFHPTEEELLEFYLKQVVHGKKLKFDIIPTVHLYRHEPSELPAMARNIGEREWYFFVPRDRKQASGGRPSRTTERGFWKATGSDRSVRTAADPKRLIGLKKTLVYYEGRAPRGTKTDWVMNEYRLPDNNNSDSSPAKEDIVLCKVYRKAVSLKEIEQRVAMEEMARSSQNTGSPMESISSSGQDAFQICMIATEETRNLVAKDGTEKGEKIMKKEVGTTELAPLQYPTTSLAQLEVPKYNGLEWMQDPFLTQLRSPWTENWSPAYYPSLLNF